MGDDAAAPALLHPRHDRARKVEGRMEIDADHACSPSAMSRQARVRPDGRVADEDVDGPQLGEPLLHHCLDGGGIRDVAEDGTTRTPALRHSAATASSSRDWRGVSTRSAPSRRTPARSRGDVATGAG